jgi:hypothetical protein
MMLAISTHDAKENGGLVSKMRGDDIVGKSAKIRYAKCFQTLCPHNQAPIATCFACIPARVMFARDLLIIKLYECGHAQE